MLRKLLALTTISFSAIFASAQSRPTLSLNAGAAVPVGKFGHTEVNNSASGFAKTGTLLSAAYGRQLKKGLWFEAALQFQQNPLNTKKMEEAFSTTRIYHGVFVGTSLPPRPAFPDTLFENWKFKNDSWLTTTLLVGINGRFSAGSSNKVFLRAKLMTGPVFVASPEIDGTSTAPNGATYLKQTDATGWGLAFTAGGGLEFDFTERIYFITNVQSFFTTKVKFEDITATLNSYSGPASNPATVSQSSMTGDARQTISTFNANVGIGLRL